MGTGAWSGVEPGAREVIGVSELVGGASPLVEGTWDGR